MLFAEKICLESSSFNLACCLVCGVHRSEELQSVSAPPISYLSPPLLSSSLDKPCTALLAGRCLPFCPPLNRNKHAFILLHFALLLWRITLSVTIPTYRFFVIFCQIHVLIVLIEYCCDGVPLWTRISRVSVPQSSYLVRTRARIPQYTHHEKHMQFRNHFFGPAIDFILV